MTEQDMESKAEHVPKSQVTKEKNPKRVAAGKKGAEARQRKLQKLIEYKNKIETAQENEEIVDSETEFNDIEPKEDVEPKQKEKSWFYWSNPYIIISCVGGACIIILAYRGYNTTSVGRSNTSVQENTQKKERDPFEMD